MTAVNLAFHLSPSSSTNFRYETDTPEHAYRFMVERTNSRLWEVRTLTLTPCETPGIYTPSLESIRTEYLVSRNAAFLMAEAIYRGILDRAAAEAAAERAGQVAAYREAIQEARELGEAELADQLVTELDLLFR